MINSKPRKVAIFTGNRAEYGLQLPLLKAVKQHPLLDYQLIVAGAHLDDAFGHTLTEIHADGFEIHAKVNINLIDDQPHATPLAIGEGILRMTEVLERLRPDFLVVYADRFEGFAAAIAASQMLIPTVHIEGGDLTEGGALDDCVRHAITKLAHLHFATNEQAATRILAMGEEAWRVFNTGFPAIDLIEEGLYATPDELKTALALNYNKPLILFTQHSISTEPDHAAAQIQPSLTVLNTFAAQGVQVITTYPNNDAGGRTIIAALHDAHTTHNASFQIHPSLGRRRYHGLLALARNPQIKIVCVGNSSSGIKETPAFGCPTVNIGSRQQGRLKGDNVIDVDYDVNAIANAITQCFYDDAFRQRCRQVKNPYYLGGAGRKIAEILASVDIDTKLLRKAMTLKGETQNGWFR